VAGTGAVGPVVVPMPIAFQLREAVRGCGGRLCGSVGWTRLLGSQSRQPLRQRGCCGEWRKWRREAGKGWTWTFTCSLGIQYSSLCTVVHQYNIVRLTTQSLFLKSWFLITGFFVVS